MNVNRQGPHRATWLAAALLGPAMVGTTALAGDAAPAAPAKAARLDLRIGDIRRYVPAEILDTPVEEQLEEIIVNGERPAPLPEQRPVPQGLGALFYGVAHPTQAWRILLPDPNYVATERSVDDPREPPGAYRGKILAPGQIFD